MLDNLAFDRRLRIAAFVFVAAAGAAGAAAIVAGGTDEAWRWVAGAAVLAIAGGVGAGLKLALQAVIATAQTLSHLENVSTHTAAKLDEVEARIGAADSRLTMRIDTLGGQLEAVASRLDGEIRSAAAAHGELSARVDTTVSAQADLAGRLTSAADALRAQVADLSQATSAELAAQRDGLAAVRAEGGATAGDVAALRGEGYQPLARRMSVEARRAMLEDWPTRLGIEVDDRRLSYLEKKLVDIEVAGAGRLAAPADTAVMRALVASALPRRVPHVLEIGVLFGLNAVYFHEVAAPRYSGFRQTLVDPFFGYYGDDAPDPFTGVPVTEEVVRSNLSRGGVPAGSCEIVVGLSTDEAVQSKVDSNGFDLVLIDGDHSYAAVVSDYAWVSGLVVPGGYVVFDDYDNPSWPDIARAVADVAADDDRFEWLGATARTAVFRRKADT